MKLAALLIVPAAIVLAAGPAPAQTRPRLVARTETVARPIDDVFATLKQYFSDPLMSRYKLASADAATHTLVATESGIDADTWHASAYCITSPMQMLFGFRDGSVTVTVKLSKAPTVKHSTLVSVTADFKGMYGSKSEPHQMDCLSRGTVEKEILAAAAPAAPTAGK